MSPNVYFDGVWDLFHVSHLKFIQRVRADAAEYFGLPPERICFIAGIVSDKDVESYKRTPICNQGQRGRMMQYCRLIDRVVPNSPLIITEQFVDEYAIDLVYHGDDSAQLGFFKVPIQKKMMRYVPYDDEQSTTKIIETIQQKKIEPLNKIE